MDINKIIAQVNNKVDFSYDHNQYISDKLQGNIINKEQVNNHWYVYTSDNGNQYYEKVGIDGYGKEHYLGHYLVINHKVTDKYIRD